MAVVKKHWLSLVLSLVICGLVTLGISIPYLLSGSVHAQLAETQPEIEPRILDAPTYSLVQDIRNEIDLTNSTIAAFGLQPNDTEQLLASIADWVVANKQMLIQNKQACRQYKNQIRHKYRQINLGSTTINNTVSLHEIKNNVLKNNSRRKQLLNSAVMNAKIYLDESEKMIWDASRNNRNIPAPYCYLPELSDQQKNIILSVDKATSTHDNQFPISQQLTFNQQQILSIVSDNLHGEISTVFEAEARVLPKPTALLSVLPNTIAVDESRK